MARRKTAKQIAASRKNIAKATAASAKARRGTGAINRGVTSKAKSTGSRSLQNKINKSPSGRSQWKAKAAVVGVAVGSAALATALGIGLYAHTTANGDKRHKNAALPRSNGGYYGRKANTPKFDPTRPSRIDFVTNSKGVSTSTRIRKSWDLDSNHHGAIIKKSIHKSMRKNFPNGVVFNYGSN